MDLLSYYVVNRPDVIHETIDGESIIINLMSGRYYSLQQTGADIWTLIENGATAADIIRTLFAKYRADGVDIGHVVVEFLAKLQREDLIRVGLPDKSEASPALETSVTAEARTDAADFTMPSLHMYTDLEDLLLLDPIHEVDEAGWPVSKTEDSLQGQGQGSLGPVV